ncbi:MAG: RecX family transcriptional regulator [Bacilli bacterium]|nr:RecX family transcriptional regulator [Bacilli bacterium]
MPVELITSVEKQKRSKYRYNIYLNELYAFSVHEDMLVKHRLLKGEYVDAARITAIVTEDEQHKALMEALRFIGRRPRSQKEVKHKLREKGYEDETIQITVQKLIEQKAIDDEQFAALWTEHRIFSQNKGRRWVQQELQQKGLSKEHILGAMANVDEEAEYQAAYDTAKKKWSTLNGESYERTRKLVSFMLRRGYSNQIVSSIIKKLTGESVEELDF